MSLTTGTRLGPYEIRSAIGSGGMGQVYKASDTRLDRIVAIKVSSEQFSERFEREARAVAALNHPHICQLYDVGPNYLVMEYVDGKPLSGPLPLDQALKNSAQICDALDAAHRKGIVHRDLKPANILVTKSGVKLLDFGLARIVPVKADEKTAQGLPLTGEGQIVGTLHYMSPEQLQGQEADARSDIFSFGLVLYEMLTGKRAFEGRSPASVIGAILEHEAPSIAGVAPTSLDRVLRRCLSKDVDQRWQTASDLKAGLEWIAAGEPSCTITDVVSRSAWRQRAAWALLATTLTALLLFAVWNRSTPGSARMTRFNIYAPEKTVFSGNLSATVPTPEFALAPDGHAIVFAASAPGTKPMLWVRPMEGVDARKLPGTEDAHVPFWSPDSRWLGFYSNGELKKTPADGGAVRTIAEGIPDPRGASWGPDDTILLATGSSAIYRVPASGGTLTPVTKLENQELSHRWPYFLPDGQHFLFTVRGGPPDQWGIYVGSLDGKTRKRITATGERKTFAGGNSNALYVSPGYLLYFDQDTLLGQEFDAKSLSLHGDPFAIPERVGVSTTGTGAISVALDGTMAYSGAMLSIGKLNWFDRGGNLIEALATEADYTDFRLSPDETRLAASRMDPKRGNPDIWMTDLLRGYNTSAFTSGPLLNASTVWSPDGTRLIFRSNRNGVSELFEKNAGGGGNDKPVFLAAAEQKANMVASSIFPTDWSPDGKQLIFSAPTIGSGSDLWTLPLFGDREPLRLLSSVADELHGNFSPNGKWLAYSSNEENGRFEVFVRPFPLTDKRWKVSNNGGYEPRWRLSDGGEIYYLSEDRKLMAVSVTDSPSSPVGTPKELFPTKTGGPNFLRTNYVPSRDGRRFLVNTINGDPNAIPITIVLNWSTVLKH